MKVWPLQLDLMYIVALIARISTNLRGLVLFERQDRWPESAYYETKLTIAIIFNGPEILFRCLHDGVMVSTVSCNYS